MIPLLRRFARWYSTPAGLLSLVFIAVAFVLAIVGQEALALLVTIGWVAFIVPHKLVSERRDWNAALAAHSASLQTQLTESKGRVDDLAAQNRRLTSELSMMPTVEEVATWQTSVEAAQAAANAGVEARLKQLEADL